MRHSTPSSTISTEPTPRHAALWAALVFALCALALAYPALGGAFLVNDSSDQYIAGYAFREFAASSLRAGQGFPLWNPYLFGGMPYVAAMHGDIFYPTFLLRMIMPTDMAMTWGFIIHLYLAGLFTYAFLRASRFGFFPSLLGGVAYMLSGQIASLASPGHDGKLFVSALFPALLWLALMTIRDGRRWAWGLLALIVGLGVLSPHPQLLQYMLLAGGAFGLFVAFSEHGGSRLERNVALQRLALATACILVGFAMGAIQFLPVREYVPWSPRAGGRDYEYATSFSMPIEELFNTYLPQFTGMLNAYWGRNPIKLHGEYLGAAVLPLATAGMTAAGARKSFRWFWIGTLVIAMLWALGGHTPFYQLVYAIVPGAKFFRAPSIMFFVVSFSVAVLAALGVERVLAREIRVGFLAIWAGVGVVITLLAVSGALTTLGESIAIPQLADRVLSNQSALALGSVRSLLFLLAALGAIYLYGSKKLSPSAVGWALVAIAATDLWSIDRPYWMFMPPAKTIYATDATIEYVKRQPEPSRVLTGAFEPTTTRHDPFLFGDGAMTHRVRIVEGYHGNQLGRYKALPREALFSPNLWRLLNIQFLLADLDSLPIPGATRVVGPVKNAAGTEVFLYRLPVEAPAAWLATAIVKATDEAVSATVLDQRFDVRSAALFDTSAAVRPVQLTAAPPPLTLAARVTRFDPGHIQVQLAGPAPAGSALVVSENYYPGWSATVDGKPAAVGRADLLLIGVELPAGARTVELTFRSRPYEQGKLITLFALGIVALLVVGGAIMERGRRD